jgi:hypothetical protein
MFAYWTLLLPSEGSTEEKVIIDTIIRRKEKDGTVEFRGVKTEGL